MQRPGVHDARPRAGSVSRHSQIQTAAEAQEILESMGINLNDIGVDLTTLSDRLPHAPPGYVDGAIEGIVELGRNKRRTALIMVSISSAANVLITALSTAFITVFMTGVKIIFMTPVAFDT